VQRTRKIATATVALSLIAAACGGSDDTAEESSNSEAPAATEAPAADEPAESGEDVTIRWRTRPDNDAEAEVYGSISDTIDAANGDAVTLTYEPGTTDGANYQDQLITEIANGTAPDVFWIPGTDIARFQSAGLILDLAPLAAEDGFDTSEFYPEPMYHLTFDPEAGAPGDKLWGLPRDVSTFAM